MDRKVTRRPPETLEKFVRLLVPAASREHVIGDLSESYQSPGRYLFAALSVLPFVIASRIRRTSNPVRVAFRAFVLWFATFYGQIQENWLVPTIPTMLATFALVLRDAYRPVTPTVPNPTRPRDAAIDIALICACVLLSQAALAQWAPYLLLPRRTLVVGLPIGCALLFVLRLQNPSGGIWPAPVATNMSYPELLSEVRGFEAVWRRALRIEICSGLVLIACSGLLMGFASERVRGLGLVLTVAGAVMAVSFFNKRLRIQPVPEGLSFAATVATYRHNLQLRVANARASVWRYLLPLLLGPAVLVFFLLLKQPQFLVVRNVATLAVFAVLFRLLRRASLRRFQQRIDQLAVVTEKQ